ncbi:MAG: aminotransferase class I/II-fold pyridoxal phosphate-dependent enzyme, partial [Candidatus Bathyarchaeota archaeon]|nr:aminotransferase class I/II-fold pyridoxal phosphate-dependent enzyme [Candidatus Bathyarchaeota archaeon]
DRLWSYHDYTTICPSPLSDRLARIALTSPKREEIINRTRRIVRSNFDIFNHWIAEHDGMLTCIPPVAGAIALVNYSLKIESLELVTRLRKEKSVLVVPGEQFMMEHYLRFGFGSSNTFLEEALQRISEFLESLSV